MKWTSALAIYLLFWALSLFLVLPFHARRAGSDGGGVAHVPGQEAGAPPNFRPWRAAGQVTLVAAGLFGLFYANYVYGWLTADSVNLFGGPAR